MQVGVAALFFFMALLCAGRADAQSAELVRAEQNYEAAKLAGKNDEAFRYGEQALSDSQETQSQIELLRDLGDFAVHSGRDERAAGYYERALHLQEQQLGDVHPDLVPLLTALADLHTRGKQYPQAAALLERIVQIERAAYGDYHENVLASLRKLRDVDQLAGDSAAVARVEQQLQPPPVASRGGLPGPADKNRRYKTDNGFATVRVFYGTNRAPTPGETKPAAFYGNVRGDLQYGYLDVTIPEVHKDAELETQPRWLEFTFLTTPAQMRSHYVLLDKVVPLPRAAFVQQLKAQIGAAPSKDVFVFVHGFNNTFEDAARRCAQLAYDLDFDGTPMLYSWPSQGSTSAYLIDEASVGISGRKLADFLETVVNESGAQRVHLIAHSMGNRALLEALQTYLARRAPDKRKHVFGQLVFTAPDVDRDYFSDAIDALRESADRTTLYAANNDYALRSSQFVHGAPRAGTAGDIIIKRPGLDSIDMSSVPADSLGHSYFAANAGAVFDIFRLLWRGDPPPQRCGMTALKDSVTGWLFNANVCKGDDLLEAGVLLKRFGDLARARVLNNIATLTDPAQKQQWNLILKRLDGLLPSTGTPASP